MATTIIADDFEDANVVNFGRRKWYSCGHPLSPYGG